MEETRNNSVGKRREMSNGTTSDSETKAEIRHFGEDFLDREGGDTDNSQQRGRHWKSVVREITANTTIEPLMFLHTVVHAGIELVIESLFVDKTCLVTLEKPKEICANLHDHGEDQIEVQKHSSQLEGYATLIENLIPIILLVYLGPLSDRYGRKIFICWSLVSEMLKVIVLLMSSIYMEEWPAWVTLIGPFLYSLGASIGGFQMLMFACVSDVTSPLNRTFRLGILKMFMGYGMPMGRLFGGQVFAAGGYIITFSVATILLIVCLVYLFFMKETVSSEDREINAMTPERNFSIIEIPRSLAVAVFRKDGYRRTIVLTDCFIHFVLFLCHKPQFFLFSRLMFDWDATDYSNWLLLKDLAAATGMLIFVPILVGHLKLTDGAVGMTGCASGVFMYILLAQIRSDKMMWLMILAPLIGMWDRAHQLASRAIISKNACGSRELGKLYSAQAILDSVSTAVAGPMYAAVYSATVESYPGAEFLLAASIMMISLLGFRICDVYIQRRDQAEAKSEKCKEVP